VQLEAANIFGGGSVRVIEARRPWLTQVGCSIAKSTTAGAAFIVRSVAADGETTWFEGLLLVGV
jgi:hypothetical protein